jgi:hypothetical protein
MADTLCDLAVTCGNTQRLAHRIKPALLWADAWRSPCDTVQIVARRAAPQVLIEASEELHHDREKCVDKLAARFHHSVHQKYGVDHARDTWKDLLTYYAEN